MFVPPYCKKQLSDAGCLALIEVLEAVGAAPNAVNLEDHSSECDGTNVTFVLAGTPNPANSLIGYVRQGGVGAFLPMIYGVDITLSGKTVTAVTTAPLASSNLYFSYNTGSSS